MIPAVQPVPIRHGLNRGFDAVLAESQVRDAVAAQISPPQTSLVGAHRSQPCAQAADAGPEDGRGDVMSAVTGRGSVSCASPTGTGQDAASAAASRSGDAWTPPPAALAYHGPYRVDGPRLVSSTPAPAR